MVLSSGATVRRAALKSMVVGQQYSEEQLVVLLQAPGYLVHATMGGLLGKGRVQYRMTQRYTFWSKTI